MVDSKQEKELSVLQKFEKKVDSLNNFIVSQSFILLAIIGTSLANLVHTSFLYSLANKALFAKSFMNNQFVAVVVAVIVCVVYDIAILAFSANEEKKTHSYIVAGILVYLNYVAYQYHGVSTGEGVKATLIITNWNTLHVVLSIAPVYLNLICVFAFHKKRKNSTNIVQLEVSSNEPGNTNNNGGLKKLAPVKVEEEVKENKKPIPVEEGLADIKNDIRQNSSKKKDSILTRGKQLLNSNQLEIAL